MSLIPATSLPAAHIAGSVAGSQRREALADQSAEASAQQRLSSDRRELSARSLGDVGEMDGSADRDADGRRYDQPAEPPPDAPAGDAPTAVSDATPRAPDAFGERGTRLDLEA
ncbi:MAG TPA: hypothetical protein VML55_15080 [Planctomycetaceae bacterium]|nr:hypothetical protein [Planctomycetaceae bacterium]